MSNQYFQFKQFRVEQGGAAMKVTTDGCLLGAFAASLLPLESDATQAVANPAVSPTHRCLSVLDIGAGTGLLSLMIAQKLDAAIEAVEIEPDAARQAAANFDASPWSARLQLIQADIREWTELQQKRYDIIISNPPFYESDLRSGKPEKDLAHHDTGLPLMQLLQTIDHLLSEDGSFFLLLPAKRKEEIMAATQSLNLFIHTLIEVSPTSKHAPSRLLIQGGRFAKTAEISRRFIKSDQEEYSPWFRELLSPYYLKL